VMLAGHMDEIGFMVKQITKEGFIKFCLWVDGLTRCCLASVC